VLTAFRAKRGPDGLRPDPAEVALLPLMPGVFGADDEALPPAVAADRDRLLAPIGDAALRAHLWSPYLDMPWDRREDGTVRAAPTIHSVAGEPVAVWHLAYHGDVALAIARTDR
jgi:hypothetical protein